MEHIVGSPARTSRTKSQSSADVSGHAYRAYQILHVGFVVAPIVAGVDKFFNLLVNWEQYLPSFVSKMVGGHGHESALTIGPAIQFMAGKTGQQIREPGRPAALSLAKYS